MLNDKQKAAVNAPADKAIRVNAGAGTGKTKVIMERIGFLRSQVKGKIMILAFNKNVAEELKVKVEKEANPWAAMVTTVDTSYGFANKLVKAHRLALGFTEMPTVPPAWKVAKLCAEAAQESGVRATELQIKALLAAEAWRRGSGANTYEAYADRSEQLTKLLKVYSHSRLIELSDHLFRFRVQQNWCLFMDMLTLALQLPDDAFQALGVTHLLVDEAQDLNLAQHHVIERLAKYASSTTIVGDVAQAIYEFTGARPDLFVSIPERYGALDYDLDTNYRCNEPILDLANKILEIPAVGTPLRLKPPEPRPGPAVFPYRDKDQVVWWLRSLLDGGVPANEIAIIFRARRDTLELEAMLSAAGIPYTSTSGSFFDHPVMADFVAYYELLLNKPTESAWSRVAKQHKFVSQGQIDAAWEEKPSAPWQTFPAAHFKNEGQKRTWRDMKAQLDALSAEIRSGSPARLFTELCASTMSPRWEETYADDPELEREYKMMQAHLREMLAEYATGEDFYRYFQDRPSCIGNGVLIISGHKSKGLEWPYVGIWGAGQGKFPLDTTAEELRLLYVAVTRAKKELAVFFHRDDPRGGLLGSLMPDPFGGLGGLSL